MHFLRSKLCSKQKWVIKLADNGKFGWRVIPSQKTDVCYLWNDDPLFQNVTGRALRRLVCSSTSSGCSCNPSGGIQSTGTWQTFHTTPRVWQTSDPNTQTSKRLVSHTITWSNLTLEGPYQFSRPLVPTEGCDEAFKSEVFILVSFFSFKSFMLPCVRKILAKLFQKTIKRK